MKKKLPVLKTDEEAEKFLEQDLTPYLHAGNFTMAKFEFQPKDKSVSLRLPDSLLNAIKKAARKRKLPYQRFIRLAVENELRRTGTKG